MEEKNREEKEFLPIGSIVVVKGTVKKLMLVARAVYVNMDGEQKYFDYGACTYPEGILNENMLYFRKQDIAEVVAEGYADEDEERMLINIRAGLEKAEERKKGEKEKKEGGEQLG